MTDKFDLLMNLATTLEKLNSEPVLSTNNGWVPLELYNGGRDKGDGKIFEAFTMVQLAAAASQEYYPIDCTGAPNKILYIRGGPGNVHRCAHDTEDRYPGFIWALLPTGVEVEIHNDVEWPDHRIGEGVHELDVSVAFSQTFDALAGGDQSVVPIMGVSCKFESTKPGKSRYRDFEALHAGTCPSIFCFLSKRAAEAVTKKMFDALERKSSGTVWADSIEASIHAPFDRMGDKLVSYTTLIGRCAAASASQPPASVPPGAASTEDARAMAL